MRKLTTTLLTIGVATILTGCGMAETPPSPTTEETTTATTETNTPPTVEEETTKKHYLSIEDRKDELAQIYDNERLTIKEWIYVDVFGVPGWVPGIVEIDGVEYTYGYGKHGWLTSITGNDGSEIIREIVVDDAGSVILMDKEYKNDKCIDYFENLSSFPRYTGFQYEGKNYVYVFDTNSKITGIKDEEGNIVAEYEYYDDNNRMGIRTINHTEEKIGDVNSLKYESYYITNDMGYGLGYSHPIQWYSREYVDSQTYKVGGDYFYLPGHLYGEP